MGGDSSDSLARCFGLLPIGRYVSMGVGLVWMGVGGGGVALERRGLVMP